MPGVQPDSSAVNITYGSDSDSRDGAFENGECKATLPLGDDARASGATSDAEATLSSTPGVNGLYGITPAPAQAVASASRTASAHIVSDDSDEQTLTNRWS
ncbi:hypothetical protein ACFYSF_03140 [Streptomyces canus]|uniref:hypothetical protein n=1 Tax=Streptomyces canus TaxID=58343 RepID=UPI0036B09B86